LRQVQHLVLAAPQHHLLEQQVQLAQVRGAVRHPAIVVAVSPAVLARERDEAARRRVAHGAQQVEQVARPVGHGRARQQKDQPRAGEHGAPVVRHAQDLQRLAGALARVLDEVRLVQRNTGPGHGTQALGMARQQVIVDDHPLRRRVLAARHAEHLDSRIGVHQADLARPVELQRGRADDEEHARGGGLLQRDDGLARLAQAHVVAQDGAAAAGQELHPSLLVGVQGVSGQVHDGLLFSSEDAQGAMRHGTCNSVKSPRAGR